MKTDANWCVRVWTLVLVITLAFAALSCGNGGGGSVNLKPGNGDSVSNGAVEKGTARLIQEDEIGTLPSWQQEMLSDPGWNQPYIAPRADTPIEGPSYEMLMEATQKAMEKGITISPRAPSGSKSVSWDDQKDYVPPTPVMRGEYETLVPNGTPTFGCNSNGSNSNAGHAIEDVIDAGTMLIPQRISYVEEGWSLANHFNETGGTGNDAQSAVYQLFSTDRAANPKDPNSTAEFGELSYRADLAPGIGPGGDCSDAEAFGVTGMFWKRFNSLFTALPAGAETQLFNILIAPSSEVTTDLTSSGETVARYQEFYFGTVSACYGGGQIIGLVSSTSSCDDFNQFVTEAQTTGFFVNPLYGVLLKRWQDSQIADMAGPWESSFGWPVFGPTAYANGSQVLTARGAYYAWGMYFEKGFIWWIDYDQDMFPTTPDEAQAYSYTGANVYCKGKGDAYIKIAPTVYYGGEGDLGVSIVVDSMRESPSDPWAPVPLNEDNTFYTVGLANDGLGQVYLAMSAHGYGGMTKDDPSYGSCLYKYYVWAFRDGTIQTAGTEYDPAQKNVVHVYGDLLRSLESVYVVRVQITDASFDLGASGNEVRAFGDSLPIHLGRGGGGGGQEIMVIRDDGGNYDASYDAIIADLGEMGAAFYEVDYSDTVADDFNDDGALVAIWYRGGPGASGETMPYNTQWTNAEVDNYLQLQNDAHGVLLIGTSQGIDPVGTVWGWWWPGGRGWGPVYGWTEVDPSLNAGQVRMPWAHSMACDQGIGYGSGYFFPEAPTNFIGATQGGHYAGQSAMAAGERYDGAGSSGNLPLQFSFGASPLQYTGICYYPGLMPNDNGPYFRGGVFVTPNAWGNDIGCISWGNERAPDHDIGLYPNWQHYAGPGKLWIMAYPYAPMTVTQSASGSMARGDVLHNALAWLNNGLTFGAGAGGGGGVAGGFGEYDGPPEIVMVKAISWYGAGGNVTEGAISYTGINYPDTTSTDVYRDFNAAPPANTDYIYDTAARGASEAGLNFNDLDFQFPLYGYIYDPDSSLIGGSPNVSGDEVLVGRGGLLVEDTDTVWTRVDPGLAGYIDWNTNTGVDPGPNPPSDTDTDDDSDWQDLAGWLFDVPWAGYYVTDDDVIANPGDDTSVKANYGVGPASLTFLSADMPVSFESIAHWPVGMEYWAGQPAFLGWSLYPGHTQFDPNTFQYYGEDMSWVNWVLDHDIDPTVPTPPADRDNSYWLYADYGYTQALADGRVVDFDYSSIDSWNGDLNMNNVLGETVADKFPCRVRLFTDYGAYDDWFDTTPPYNDDPNLAYPNHWPDQATFIEGGCYLVDNSTAGVGGPPSIIPEEVPSEIAAGNTIRWTGTYPASPSWECDVTYTIDVGCGFPMQIAYDIDGDISLDPLNFDIDVMGIGRNAPGTYTETLAFTAGDINNYIWTDGDQTYLVIRGVNAQGVGLAFFSVPLWLGDVIMFNNMEPPFAQSDIIISGWFTWRNNMSDWCVFRAGVNAVDGAWLAAPDSRSWVTSPSPLELTTANFYDSNDASNPTWQGGYYKVWLAPEQQVPNNDDVYFSYRMAVNFVGSPDFIAPAANISLGGAWGDTIGWNITAAGGYTNSDVLTPTVYTINMTQRIQEQQGENGFSNKNPQTFRYCFAGAEYYSPATPPVGLNTDNWLFTHASTAAPWV